MSLLAGAMRATSQAFGGKAGALALGGTGAAVAGGIGVVHSSGELYSAMERGEDPAYALMSGQVQAPIGAAALGAAGIGAVGVGLATGIAKGGFGLSKGLWNVAKGVKAGQGLAATSVSATTAAAKTKGPGMLSRAWSSSANRAGSGSVGGYATMAAVGGAANYATGGDFWEGAMAGAAVGGGIGMAARSIRGGGVGSRGFLGSMINKTGYKGGGGGDSVSGLFGKMVGSSPAVHGPAGAGGWVQPAIKGTREGGTLGFSQAASFGRKNAMLAGAGLAGLTYGGDRRSHSRGFNGHRGARI